MGRPRQADVASTARPCQLFTSPAHCRFEAFQGVRARGWEVLRSRAIPPEGVAEARGRRARGQRNETERSLSAFLVENKYSTKFSFHRQFSPPHAVLAGAALGGRRGGAGAMRTAPEGGDEPLLRAQNREFGFEEQGAFCEEQGAAREQEAFAPLTRGARTRNCARFQTAAWRIGVGAGSALAKIPRPPCRDGEAGAPPLPRGWQGASGHDRADSF